MLLVGSYDLDL